MMSEREVRVKQDLKASRRQAAEQFGARMRGRRTLVVRLLSSPGSGKTTLLERTCQRLGREFQVAVLVGDVETERDAQRLAPYAPSRQITTGGACHLELPLIERALADLNRERAAAASEGVCEKVTGAASRPALAHRNDEQPPLDFLLIEDIGNLICPASHPLGEHLRVIALSTTEGDDKPGKYPKAFRTSQVVVITKTDLLPYVPFSVERAKEDARRVQPALEFFTLSALNDSGVDRWCDYLVACREQMLAERLGVAAEDAQSA